MTEDMTMKDPFACVRCAAVNPTCCRMDPARAEQCFPLSRAELQRLEAFAAELGVPGAVAEKNSRSFLRSMRNLFPDKAEALAACFPEDGEHLRLALDEKGACVFLREHGCALPRHARPWYCQLFPIWIRKGFFDYFNAEACLIAREAGSIKDVFAAAGTSPEEAKELYIALCRDWGLSR